VIDDSGCDTPFASEHGIQPFFLTSSPIKVVNLQQLQCGCRGTTALQMSEKSDVLLSK
jgi:hypothetical protein